MSIGDYVLNGGEVAALAITEAVVRLIPGVIGNPDSLVEESHNQAGVVEYPTFTKPPEWRGLKVPEILTSEIMVPSRIGGRNRRKFEAETLTASWSSPLTYGTVTYAIVS